MNPFLGYGQDFSSRSWHLWVLAFILIRGFFPPVECCLSQNSISDGKTVRCPKCKVVYRKHIMWHCEERMESSHKNTATCWKTSQSKQNWRRKFWASNGNYEQYATLILFLLALIHTDKHGSWNTPTLAFGNYVWTIRTLQSFWNTSPTSWFWQRKRTQLHEFH